MGKRQRWLAATGLTAVIGGTALGVAASSPADQPGVRGKFSAIMMVHTRSSTYGDLPGVRPWNGARVKGSGGEYRSIACNQNAPVNNISSDLPSYGTRVKGSRAPASMRAQPFGFEVRRNKRTKRWEMVGSVRFIVCKLGPGPTPVDDPVPDANKPQIVIGFRAPFKKESPELVRFAGRFRITGGTQRYNDLRGAGRIAGYLFCFAPDGCAARGGNMLDGQFVLNGKYHDPTPDLAAGAGG